MMSKISAASTAAMVAPIAQWMCRPMATNASAAAVKYVAALVTSTRAAGARHGGARSA